MLVFFCRDGRLVEGDQILAIDGQPLDSAITHQQAIGILQQARGEVEIVVARALVDSSNKPSLSPSISKYPSLLSSYICVYTVCGSSRVSFLSLGDRPGAGQQPPESGGERPSLLSPFEKDNSADMVVSYIDLHSFLNLLANVFLYSYLSYPK